MSAIALPAPLESARHDNKWLVTISIGFGALMATIDLSIVNVALPQMRGSLGANIDEMASVATSFAIAQVIVMPLTAFLGRFFGQKRVYLFCLGLFLVGSALCGMARTLSQLILARSLQGLGGGALQPTQQAILRQTFPPREQAMAMAMVALAVLIGPAVGPTLGGWIVDNWSWPWIFYINLPIGVLGIVMVSRFVHEPPDIRAAAHAAAARMRKNMDWVGIALMSVGFACTQYVLEEGPRHDWFDKPEVAIGVPLAIIGVVGFIVRELTAGHPAVRLHLFKDSVFSSATLIGGVMFAMLMANMFLLPVYMQELLGFTALQSGLVLMPRSLLMMVITPIVGRIYNHVSPRLLVALGVIGVAAGSWQMSFFTLSTGQSEIMWALLIQGVGFSCLFIPLTTLALSHVTRPQIADASGLNSLVRQFGGSLGLAIFTTLLTHYIVRARAGILVHLDPTRPEVAGALAGMQRRFTQQGMDALQAHQAALATISGMVQRQASMVAFDRMFFLTGVLMLLLLPLVILLKQPPAEPALGRSAEIRHVEL